MTPETFMAAWSDKLSTAAEKALFRITEEEMGHIYAKLSEESLMGTDSAIDSFLEAVAILGELFKGFKLDKHRRHLDIILDLLGEMLGTFRDYAHQSFGHQEDLLRQSLRMIDIYEKHTSQIFRRMHETQTAYQELMAEVREEAARYQKSIPPNVRQRIESKFQLLPK